MKFVDIKNDVAFRKIFDNENRKERLISFLNAILDFRGDQWHREYHKKKTASVSDKGCLFFMVLFSWEY